MNRPLAKFAPKLFMPLLLLMASSSLSLADESLEEGLSRLAEKVASIIDEEKGEKAVLVGDFIAPPRLKASGGPGISRLIEAALKKRGVAVRDKAPYQLVGSFTVRDEKVHDTDRHEAVALRISASLLDRSDEELKKISISIHGPSALQLTGGTADIPPKASEEEAQERARRSIENPQAALMGSETRATADSPFGIEVRVRRGQSKESDVRPPQLVEGRSFVKLNKGEEYVVRLSNRAAHEAAVTLTIDGLNMFAFSEEGNFGSQVLIPPGHFVEIPGWYINKAKSEAFEITSYAKSAAASRGVVSGVGTITASFAASWDPSAHPPADEVSPKSADTATGRGRQIEQKYEKVNRVVGRVRSVVSVRYVR